MPAFRARLVLPISSPPIENGVVEIVNGRIASVGRATDAAVDLGDVVLLPGLVNAHTHLEFSDLDKPLGTAGTPFPDWIRAIVAQRRSSPSGDRDDTIRQGLTESCSHGVTCLGDIVTDPFNPAVLKESRLTGIAFYELLGLGDDQTARLTERAKGAIGDFPELDHLPGLSPHAPYTVSLRSLAQIVEVARKTKVPVAMHLAESREELDLLHTRAGRLVGLLEDWGVWHPDVIPHDTSPLRFLECLARAHRSLVIHGNYLTQQELDYLADQRDRMSVVYCPRTHTFFEHEAYPLETLLAAGVNVALGTDSRASNPDLNLLAEAQHACASHPNVSPQRVIEMATINGARALGLDKVCGSLEVGKRADMVALSSAQNGADVLESILTGPASIQAVFAGGTRVV